MLVHLKMLVVVPILVLMVGPQLPDSLIVTGKDFAFGVEEPSGWHGDTKNAAAIAANIVFLKDGESPQQFSALIYVKIIAKTDEKVDKDLKADMAGYKREHPSAEFRDFKATHPKYAVFPKLFVIPGQSFEYVAYVNPGKGKSWVFSVSMNVPGRAASVDELRAYQAVLSSVALLTA